ncbi:MAG: DUF4258 domain-containing protein [Desulfobacterales bacterium]|nr:DUF4258 domain-containing protein [Desulfobacterales bacterium]
MKESFLDNPLKFIRQCVQQRKIQWTYHVNMRLKNRGISREAIVSSISQYEIIEEYPKDKYFPSYLIYSQYQNIVFHVLFAADIECENVRVITAYIPNSEKWEGDLKTRR